LKKLLRRYVNRPKPIIIFFFSQKQILGNRERRHKTCLLKNHGDAVGYTIGRMIYLNGFSIEDNFSLTFPAR
jgi:hypothetical protein